MLVTAMEQARVKRLVCVTGFGAGDSRDRGGFFYCVASHLLLGRIYDDKDVQEHIVRRSKLDWVIVRPVILTNRLKTNAYSALIDSRDWTCGFISRADVADFLVEQIDNDAFLHKIQCSRAEGIVALAKPMIEKKKIDIVDDFINKVQSHPTAMQKAQRIDDLEAVLRAIFVSDDEQAIEMSDKIRSVIARKHVTLEKRVRMLEKILREGGVHV